MTNRKRNELRDAIESGGQAVFRCPEGGCCPVADFARMESHDEVTITDDHGNTVLMTTANWNSLVVQIKALP